jgi:hypothetical protein
MIDYEIQEKSIKFKNISDNEIKMKIIGIIAGTDRPMNNFIENTLKSGYWYIPDFNYKGLSCLKIFINEKYSYTLSLPNHLTKFNKYKSKIVGIGLNKTGTTSFAESLSKCGFKLSNVVRDSQDLSHDYHNGNIYSTLSILDYPNYDVYQDLPFSTPGIYKKLYEYRPQDYYTLTIRDNTEQWVNSAYKFFKITLEGLKNNYDSTILDMYYTQEGKIILNRNYRIGLLKDMGINSTLNIKDKLKDVYNKHLDDVNDFFSHKTESNFMIINVSKENELKRVSEYIGFESVDNNFVWVNKSEN